MKEYTFEWNEEIYLIHVQFDALDFDGLLNKNIEVIRTSVDNSRQTEQRYMTNDGFRFIISRSCPAEKSVTVIYSEDVTLKVFLIDDRAYYPTESFYEG